MDSNDSTCLSFTVAGDSGTIFMTKFPWPVLGSTSQSFTASLRGRNLGSCSGMVKLETILAGERTQCTPPSDSGTAAETGIVRSHVPVELKYALWCTSLSLTRTFSSVRCRSIEYFGLFDEQTFDFFLFIRKYLENILKSNVLLLSVNILVVADKRLWFIGLLEYIF